jgi:hypothetical protein
LTLPRALRVDLAVDSGSASALDDLALSGPSVTFDAGSGSGSLQVELSATHDDLFEDLDETAALSASVDPASTHYTRIAGPPAAIAVRDVDTIAVRFTEEGTTVQDAGLSVHLAPQVQFALAQGVSYARTSALRVGLVPTSSEDHDLTPTSAFYGPAPRFGESVFDMTVRARERTSTTTVTLGVASADLLADPRIHVESSATCTVTIHVPPRPPISMSRLGAGSAAENRRAG